MPGLYCPRGYDFTKMSHDASGTATVDRYEKKRLTHERNEDVPSAEISRVQQIYNHYDMQAFNCITLQTYEHRLLNELA